MQASESSLHEKSHLLPCGKFCFDSCDRRATRTDALGLPKWRGREFESNRSSRNSTGIQAEDFQELLIDRSSEIGKKCATRINSLEFRSKPDNRLPDYISYE